MRLLFCYAILCRQNKAEQQIVPAPMQKYNSKPYLFCTILLYPQSYTLHRTKECNTKDLPKSDIGHIFYI